MSQIVEQDADLVLLAQAGDQAAFTALYDAYFKRIYDFCYQMVRNTDDAADLVSEVFLKAMERLGSLKDPDAFRGWLYAIARNAALTMIDRRKRTTGMPEEHEPVRPMPGTQAPADPVDVAEAGELSMLVWEAAATLNPRDYSIVEMLVRQGLESSEIAQQLGVAPAHGYVLVSRAKDAVEEALGAVVLARAGRRDCTTLDAIVAGFGDERSPRMRKAVLRHLKGCDDCTSSKKKYASAAALLNGVAYAEPGPGLQERVAQRLQEAWPPRHLRRLRRLARASTLPMALVLFAAVGLAQHASPETISGAWVPVIEEVAPTAIPTPAITPEPTPQTTDEPAAVAPTHRIARSTPRPTPRPLGTSQPPIVIVITPAPQQTQQPTTDPCRTVPQRCGTTGKS